MQIKVFIFSGLPVYWGIALLSLKAVLCINLSRANPFALVSSWLTSSIKSFLQIFLLLRPKKQLWAWPWRCTDCKFVRTTGIPTVIKQNSESVKNISAFCIHFYCLAELLKYMLKIFFLESPSCSTQAALWKGHLEKCVYMRILFFFWGGSDQGEICSLCAKYVDHRLLNSLYVKQP